MQEKVEKSNNTLIPSFNPRASLSKSINLTKDSVDSIIFYKKVINNINELKIKKGSNIPKYVLDHIIKYNYDVLNPNITYCIDDRTTEKQDKGVSIPGGTDGLLATAFHYIADLGLEEKLSCEKIYSNLLETIGGEINYYTHSDSHNINSEGRIGCGHCNVAFNNGDHLLELKEKHKKFMLNLRYKNKETHHLDILKGEHMPEGVLLIDNADSKEKLSIIQKGINSQFFVYNRNAEKNILSRFIETLNKNEDLDINLDKNSIDEIAFKAYLSTLEHLGAGNIPHYTIKYNKKIGKYRIKTIGNVNSFIANHK